MKPTQARMFQTEDLPLFSMTAPRCTLAEYQPEPASLQIRLPGLGRCACCGGVHETEDCPRMEE